MAEMVIFVVSMALVAGYITGILCRRAVSRRRLLDWNCAWIGVLGADIVTVIAVGQRDLLHPASAEVGKIPIWYPIATFCFIASMVGLLAGCIVVWYYRRVSRSRQDVA